MNSVVQYVFIVNFVQNLFKINKLTENERVRN